MTRLIVTVFCLVRMRNYNCAHARTELNLGQNLIRAQMTVQSWTEFNARLALNCVGATKTVTERRSGSNLNSVQAWSSFVQQGLRVALQCHHVNVLPGHSVTIAVLCFVWFAEIGSVELLSGQIYQLPIVAGQVTKFHLDISKVPFVPSHTVFQVHSQWNQVQVSFDDSGSCRNLASGRSAVGTSVGLVSISANHDPVRWCLSPVATHTVTFRVLLIVLVYNSAGRWHTFCFDDDDDDDDESIGYVRLLLQLQTVTSVLMIRSECSDEEFGFQIMTGWGWKVAAA